MTSYVKIRIEDESKKMLEHYYIEGAKWDLPAGRIEKGGYKTSVRWG